MNIQPLERERDYLSGTGEAEGLHVPVSLFYQTDQVQPLSAIPPFAPFIYCRHCDATTDDSSTSST